MRIAVVFCLAMLALASPALAAVDQRLSEIAGVTVECRTTVIPPAEVGSSVGTVHGYYDPGGAQILDRGVEIGRTEPRIVLAPHVCGPLRFRGYSRVRETMLRRAFAWHLFAHEYAHAQGYDHGETTIGADCAAHRYYMRPLMLAYGVDPVYAHRLWRIIPDSCSRA